MSVNTLPLHRQAITKAKEWPKTLDALDTRVKELLRNKTLKTKLDEDSLTAIVAYTIDNNSGVRGSNIFFALNNALRGRKLQPGPFKVWQGYLYYLMCVFLPGQSPCCGSQCQYFCLLTLVGWLRAWHAAQLLLQASFEQVAAETACRVPRRKRRDLPEDCRPRVQAWATDSMGRFQQHVAHARGHKTVCRSEERYDLRLAACHRLSC